MIQCMIMFWMLWVDLVERFASTPTTTTSTPMDIRAPTLTFSTTTKTSCTTVRHKLTRRSSLRPVCAALVEEVRLGFLEHFQAMSKVVVKTHQPNIWTHRISLVQHTTPRDVLCTTLQISTPHSSVVCAVEVSRRHSSIPSRV